MQRAPVNNQMLIWARERCGKTLEEVADRFPQIRLWEENTRKPTVKQARDLADFYHRSFLEFFRVTFPKILEPESIPDFRMERGFATPSESYELRQLQTWAEAKRVNALDLLNDLGEPTPIIPNELFLTVTENVETAAAKARRAIQFSIDEQTQIAAREAANLADILRAKIEKLGILVFRNPDVKHFRARGICIAKFPLPVIVYASEFPGAQAFTIVHEFAHILLKQSGIIGYETRTSPHATEKWCDNFAAAFLMPKDSVVSVVGAMPTQPQSTFDESQLSSAATHFRVSRHAMLVRLVQLGYVTASYYWDVKKPEFDEEERQYKSFGRGKYYGTRYKNSLGSFYTGLVIEAWNAGKITNHNAAEYMGIKNITHLFDIRSNYQA